MWPDESKIMKKCVEKLLSLTTWNCQKWTETICNTKIEQRLLFHLHYFGHLGNCSHFAFCRLWLDERRRSERVTTDSCARYHLSRILHLQLFHCAKEEILSHQWCVKKAEQWGLSLSASDEVQDCSQLSIWGLSFLNEYAIQKML